MNLMQTSNRRIMLRTFVPLTVVVLVAGLYASSLDNPMIMEDQHAIADNPLVTGSHASFAAWISPSFASRAGDPNKYQPINIQFLRWNNQITGMSPLGFRVVNIGLLGVLGLLIVGWLNLYTDYPAAALLAALLFVAHPLNAESINHLVGRGELLAMIGLVGFAWIQRLALTRPSDEVQSIPGPRARPHRLINTALLTLASAALGFLAIFSSPTGLVLIPIAVIQPLICRSRRRRIADSQGRAIILGGWVCLAIVAWLYAELYSLAAQTATVDRLAGGTDRSVHQFVTNPMAGLTAGGSIPEALWLAWFYLRQVFWPDMRLFHWPAESPDWHTPSVYLGLTGLLFICGWLLVSAYRKRWGSVAACLILGQYVVVGNVLFFSARDASNLLTMPFTLAAAVVVARWIDLATETTIEKRSSRKIAVSVIPTGIVVVLMALGVWQVNQRWFSAARLMAWELSRRPGTPALMYGYGRALIEVGSYARALYWLESALIREPQSTQIRHALALAHLMQGDPNAATHQYLRIIEVAPQDCTAHTQVAALAMSGADLDTAGFHLDQAQRSCPHDPDVMYHLARLALARQDRALAFDRYETLLRRWPNHAVARQELAELLTAPQQ